MMRKSASRYVFEVFNSAFIVFLCVLMLYPFLFVLAASLSSSSAVARGMVGSIPQGFNLRAYSEVLKYKNIWTGYRNTILYTVAGTGLNLVLTICGAYPLSRRQFAGKGVFTFFIAVTLFFSGGLIPTYLVMRSYKLLNTFWVMILPGAISTWNLIVMRTFFQNLPVELEESAIIDGCSDIGVLLRIIIPLSTASIMTIGMFYAVGHWNAWFNAFIYLRDNNLYPVQLWLRMIVLQNQMNDISSLQSSAVDLGVENLISETIKYAVIVVAAAPILCVYPFIQKYFVKGVMVGSIKG
jgi:ABC-type glycerol-3-phosphate transport system permease component